MSFRNFTLTGWLFIVLCLLGLAAFRPEPALPPGEAGRAAASAWEELRRRAGLAPSLPPKVFIYRDYGAFAKRVAEMGLDPDATIGYWDNEAIHVDASGGPVQTRNVIRHELAHALIAPGRPPRWFNEGFAQFFAGRRDDMPQRIEELAANYWVGAVELADLGRNHSALDLSGMNTAYRAAEAAVRAVVLRWGEDRLWRLAGDLARGVPFEQAWERNYGLTLGMPAALFDVDWLTLEGGW